MLLAIETSTRRGSIALIDDGEAAAFHVLPADRDHGRTLAADVAALAGARLAAVEAYVLSIGPGSFTGLRVGLAFVKGMALVTGRPVVPVSSLLVVAEGAGGDSVVPLLDARGGEVYAAWYRNGSVDPRLQEGLHPIPAVVDAIRQETVLLAGDAAPMVVSQVELQPGWSLAPEDRSIPDARVLGRIGWRLWREGLAIPAETIEPAYHQPSAPERRLESVTKTTPSR